MIIENQKYLGYFCQKCKSIPLIQILVKETPTKIFNACKCYKKYEKISIFLKNKSLKNEIDINEISKESINTLNNFDQNSEKNIIDINEIKNKFNKAKKDLLFNSNELKNKLIKLYEDKIKEVKEMYNNYISRNNLIIEVIEKIIKSYELIKDNPSNIQNILNNCIFDNKFRITSLLESIKTTLDQISLKLKNYFKEELIISDSITNKVIKKENLTNNFYCPVNNFFELDANLYAWCSKYKSYIAIMNQNIKESYNLNFNAHLKYVNYMIKTSENNIISNGDDGFIKIWPKINMDLINSEIKDKKIGNNWPKIIDINVKPLLEYRNEKNNMKEIIKMINIKNNQFLASSRNNIFLFNYTLNPKEAQLNLINIYDYQINTKLQATYTYIDSIVDINSIQKNKEEVLALVIKNNMNFLTMPNFELLDTIKVKSMIKNCLIQINDNELLIVDNIYYLKIIDINNFQIKLTIKSPASINMLLKLNDGTVLYAGFEGIRRLLIKTMEYLPDLIHFHEDDEYYYYDDYFRDEIVHLSLNKNGIIVACFQNGTIQFLKLPM
jgi:hypothetical protein